MALYVVGLNGHFVGNTCGSFLRVGAFNGIYDYLVEYSVGLDSGGYRWLLGMEKKETFAKVLKKGCGFATALL